MGYLIGLEGLHEVLLVGEDEDGDIGEVLLLSRARFTSSSFSSSSPASLTRLVSAESMT